MNIDKAYVSDLLDTLNAAQQLHERTPPNEDAPGLKAQVNAAVTFLTGAAQGVRTIHPELFEEVVKTREATGQPIPVSS